MPVGARHVGATLLETALTSEEYSEVVDGTGIHRIRMSDRAVEMFVNLKEG